MENESMKDKSNKRLFFIIFGTSIVILVFLLLIVFYDYKQKSSVNDYKNSADTSIISQEKAAFEEFVGKQAPAFELENIEGSIIRMKDFKNKNIILFFNEGSMCYPSCWNQIAQLSNDQRFNNDNVASFSIVVDPKERWQEIIKKVPQMSLAKILFDNSRAVSSAYHTLYLQSSMHKGSLPGHTYFIINKEGIIKYVLDDPSMAINNDKLASELDKLIV